MAESNTNASKRSPMMVIFTTVLIDLIGFGMVIPLIGLYGKHFGASGAQLALLGGIYSLLQFFFAPVWGALSDRYGRRPIILISLMGSTISYLIFSQAPDYTWLLASRALGGIFAANISAAQAYIADITTPDKRARGMGLIGAAFGIGFTLGPPLGGIAAAKLGLAAPGLIAACICGINFLAALVRLPESLPVQNRTQIRSLNPLDVSQLRTSARSKATHWAQSLPFLLGLFFFVTFAFSMIEQTFSLLFQVKFSLQTQDAGLKTGLVLMVCGLASAIIQGGMIAKLVKRYGEKNLLVVGLGFNIVTMALFPFVPTYSAYFLAAIPLAIGSALLNPSLSSLISKTASSMEQGKTMGISQGLGSLARATGPFCGLLTFELHPALPFLIASLLTLILIIAVKRKQSQLKAHHLNSTSANEATAI